MTFHSVGNVTIPTDFHSIIFQRGWSTTKQIHTPGPRSPPQWPQPRHNMSQRSLSSCIFQSSLCPAYSVPRTCFTTNCVIYVYIYIHTSLINITYLRVVHLASSLPIYSLHPTYTIYTCFFHRVPQKYEPLHSVPMYY